MALHTVMSGNSSRGNTIFFTKLGLLVMSVGDLTRHSEKTLKIIRPEKSIKTYSLVVPEVEVPQRNLRKIPNTTEYTNSRYRG
jgi:hypothetical protein